jgi:hypothetical protein
VALPWQVVGDCGHCRTAGAVLELVDPSHAACHLGVPAHAVCRMCGREETADAVDLRPLGPLGVACPSCEAPLDDRSRAGRTCGVCGFAPATRITPGVDVRDRETARAALQRWADAEGMGLDAHCECTLGAGTDEVLDRYAAGMELDTGMDVIAFLFPSMAAGSAASSGAEPARTPAARPDRMSPPADPRAATRLLASVMTADGELRVGERAFVDAWITREGLPPLDASDLRPWRPHELGPVGDSALAERALEAAVELMHLDGERDGSELRVGAHVRARVGGCPKRGWKPGTPATTDGTLRG